MSGVAARAANESREADEAQGPPASPDANGAIQVQSSAAPIAHEAKRDSADGLVARRRKLSEAAAEDEKLRVIADAVTVSVAVAYTLARLRFKRAPATDTPADYTQGVGRGPGARWLATHAHASSGGPRVLHKGL